MHPFFDLNDDEREEYTHDSLINYATPPGIGIEAFRRAHDRKYGKGRECPYCAAAEQKFMEPRLKRLEAAFKREPSEPVLYVVPEPALIRTDDDIRDYRAKLRARMNGHE